MKNPLVITGCQLLTPLDLSGGGDTWSAMCAGKRIERQVAVAEELLDSDAGLDRSIRLALAAARKIEGPLADAALFCGTSKGPIGTFLAAYDCTKRGEMMSESQARHVELGVGAMGTMVREKLGIGGPAHTSVAACSSGLHALHRAAAAVRQGDGGGCRRALVLAADASLHPLFEGSFERLGVLSPTDGKGARRCTPFGDNGDGFFLIEAAAAILIESPEVLGGRKPLAWLDDSWIGADSTDLIAIDAQTRTLRAGLREFEQPPPGVAFVHAHATGTGHDAYELEAIRAVCGREAPVFSHKHWLGHSLGAAGLVSVAISVLAHQHGRTPAGTNVAGQSRSLTIAQGFGGHVGIVALRGA